MKTKKIKALKMWGGRLQLYSTYYAAEPIYGKITREKYVLYADAASVEAMIEQMARAMMDTAGCPLTTKDLSRAALAAIGIYSRAPKS